MRLGIAIHEGRISPVLDVALRLLVVSVDGERITGRHEVSLAASSLHGRSREIQAAGVEVLICGAVSWPLEAALATAGVRVVAQVCGRVDDVLQAFLSGRLTQHTYLMPGACGRKRHRPVASRERRRFGARSERK